MPPVQGAQMPPQVNPALLQALRARAQAGAGGPAVAGPMPNGMNAPVLPRPAAPAVNLARPGGAPGAGMPAQQMMKAGAQAQSPVMDPGTRTAAKQLIMQLMKHM